jgi:hypothetical protein
MVVKREHTEKPNGAVPQEEFMRADDDSRMSRLPSNFSLSQNGSLSDGFSLEVFYGFRDTGAYPQATEGRAFVIHLL